MKIDPFWLEGDDFILFTTLIGDRKTHTKFYFYDSTVSIFQKDENNNLYLQTIIKRESKFKDLTITNDVAYTFMNENISRHSFDFVIISKQSKMIQVIPVGSILNESISCISSFNNNLGLLLNEYNNVSWTVTKKGSKVFNFPNSTLTKP
jgi:hypothetical protein